MVLDLGVRSGSTRDWSALLNVGFGKIVQGRWLFLLYPNPEWIGQHQEDAKWPPHCLLFVGKIRLLRDLINFH